MRCIGGSRWLSRRALFDEEIGGAADDAGRVVGGTIGSLLGAAGARQRERVLAIYRFDGLHVTCLADELRARSQSLQRGRRPCLGACPENASGEILPRERDDGVELLAIFAS